MARVSAFFKVALFSRGVLGLERGQFGSGARVSCMDAGHKAGGPALTRWGWAASCWTLRRKLTDIQGEEKLGMCDVLQF